MPFTLTDDALNALLDQLPVLAGRPRRLEDLSGGLTNRNVKVSTDNGVYVARCADAGSAPAATLNPTVVEAMAEIGVDLTTERPKLLTDDAVRTADVVITMGCGDACPCFPGKQYLDWELDDPAGRALDAVRPIRDEIDRRVRALADELLA